MRRLKPRAEMSAPERRLDLYTLLALIVATPLIVLGFTTGTSGFFLLAVLVLVVGSMGTEVTRARRYRHPVLNRWIARRSDDDA